MHHHPPKSIGKFLLVLLLWLAAIGQLARGFEFAVFDRETGLFILIDQFG